MGSSCSLPQPALHSPPSVPSVALLAPEPMQVGSYHLTPAEHQRRLLNHLCLYCGGEGHIITSCPTRPPRPAVSTIQLPPKDNRSSLNTPFFHFSASPHRLWLSGELPISPPSSISRGNAVPKTYKFTPFWENRWAVVASVTSPPPHRLPAFRDLVHGAGRIHC